jgi:DNA-binding response OmpR family regulator
MSHHPARLLCTGNEADLLQSRCAVLRHAGYDAQAASLTEAEILLGTEKYDLVIISAGLSQWDRGRILSAAGKTPTYVLQGLTFAPELLAQAEQRLPPVSQSASDD